MKKLLILIMLLISVRSYSSNINDSTSFTGGVLKSDTTAVINIGYIRLANIKMIERNYLRSIVKEQDSIINMKNKYINEQQKIIIDFQQRVADANKLNEAVKKDLEKQKTKNKIIGYGAGAAILGLILGLIAK